jgi:hypothetical protein
MIKAASLGVLLEDVLGLVVVGARPSDCRRVCSSKFLKFNNFGHFKNVRS